MKVKYIGRENPKLLEDAVNDFIEGKQVHNIQFITTDIKRCKDYWYSAYIQYSY